MLIFSIQSALFSIITIFLYFSQSFLPLATDVITIATTGDIKPLLKDVMEIIIVSDITLDKTVDKLKNPDIDSDKSYGLRNKLFFSIFIMFFVIWAVYKLLKFILKLTASEYTMTISMRILFVFISIVIIAFAELLYSWFVLKQVIFPFHGLFNLSMNIPVIINNGVSEPLIINNLTNITK